mgnify:FL=1
MNRSFNKYKKAQWINVRLSKQHKARVCLKKTYAAGIFAQGAAVIEQINLSGSLDRVGKAAAIASAALETFVSVSNAMSIKDSK